LIFNTCARYIATRLTIDLMADIANKYSELDDGISHFYAIEAVNACGATP
jgi:hypothetical protein